MKIIGYAKNHKKTIRFLDDFAQERYDLRYNELKSEYQYIVKIKNDSIEYLKGDEDTIKRFMESDNDENKTKSSTA